MTEFLNSKRFDIKGWLKRQYFIGEPRDDQWAEQQSEAAAVVLKNRSNIERYDRYKRKGGTLYDKKNNKTPT